MTETIDDKCIWVKSPSITEGNEMYETCHKECDGTNKYCPNYLNWNYDRIKKNE